MPETEPSLANQPPQAVSTSLGNRLVNVFIAPSEVFDEVKNSPPQALNWVVPMALGIIAGIIYCMVVFSQPAIIQQMRQPTEQRFEKMVKDGKMTQQAADQQLAMIERFLSPSFLKVTGILGTIFMQAFFLFFFALILWLIGTFLFRSQIEYMKAVEAVGLSVMIGIPALLIKMLLAVIYGNLAMTLGPVLLVSHFEQSNPVHVLLSSLDVMTVWSLAVIGIALARLANTSFIKAAIWPFGIWAVLISIRLAFLVVFGGK